jgi:hypothetical protein
MRLARGWNAEDAIVTPPGERRDPRRVTAVRTILAFESAGGSFVRGLRGDWRPRGSKALLDSWADELGPIAREIVEVLDAMEVATTHRQKAAAWDGDDD